jgi:quercetin dioxygenase-like cupin family protein
MTRTESSRTLEALGATLAGGDEGEALWGLGGLLIVKLGAAQTGGRFALLEQRMQRGCSTPLHVHPADEETFIVLEGELGIWVDGDWHRAPAGTIAHIPAERRPHAWKVESELARTLVLTSPGHEAFYRAACEPAPAPVQPPFAGRVDVERIRPIAQAHGVEFLGPTPEP